MPRLTFQATKAAFEATDDALICGVASDSETYLLFQRTPEGMEEDDGVYLEFSDQISSGYQQIRRCTVTRRHFSVDLMQPFRKRPDINGFDVELDINDADYMQLCVGLRRIFRGQLHVLTVVA